MEGFPFTVRTLLTKAEFMRIMQARLLRPRRIILAVLVFIAICANTYFNGRHTPHRQASDYWMILSLTLAGLYIAFSIRRGLRKAYEGNPRLAQPISYTFSEEGVSTSGEGYHTELGWQHFVKMEESKQALFMFSTSRIASVLKKADLTEGQLRLIRSKAQQMAKARAKAGRNLRSL